MFMIIYIYTVDYKRLVHQWYVCVVYVLCVCVVCVCVFVCICVCVVCVCVLCVFAYVCVSVWYQEYIIERRVLNLPILHQK